MLQVCFMFNKMQKKLLFFYFHFMQIYFFRNDCPGQRQHRDQEIHKGKSKLSLNEKNIANFEVFYWNISMSANLLFMNSGN